MGKDVQDKIIEMVKNQIKYLDRLDITWYGGEPLVALDVIENLSHKFIPICKEHNVQYAASIVSNGYMLNEDVAKKLKELNVTDVQITIDGPKEIHNIRRPLVGGQPTYDKIIENVSNVYKFFKGISIRINTDKKNYNKIKLLLEDLKKINANNIYPYLGYVEPTNACYNQNECLFYSKFCDIDYDFHKELIRYGFIKDMSNKYPTLRSNVCCADAISGYVIDPEGYVYKCWSDVGMKEFAVDNITNKDDKQYNVMRMLNYVMYDPTVDDNCSKCKYLPLCMGGCARRRIDNNVERCVDYKYLLDKYIKNSAEILYEELQKKKESEKHNVSIKS